MDETQGLVKSCETSITTGLRCEPVAQAEVCDVARPCPRPWAAGGGSDGAETRPPDTAGSEKNRHLWQVSQCSQGYPKLTT